MLFAFRKNLAPPEIPGDESQTRRAGFLNIALLSVMTLELFTIAGNLLGAKTPWAVTAMDAGIFLACLVSRYAMRRGRVNESSAVMLGLGFLSITVTIILLGTIRTPTTADYMILVIGAGLLFDLPGILASTVVCSLAVLGLIVAENAGLLPQPDYAVTITQWVTYTALFGLIGGMTWNALQTMRSALEIARSELALRQLTEADLFKFKLALERSGEAIFMTDPDGAITYVNPAFERIYGFSEQEALGQNPRILKSGVMPPERYQHFWQTLLAGQIVTGELINKARDGHFVSAEGSANPIVNPAGDLIGFLAIQRDVSERKKADQVLQEAVRALRENETIFSSFLEHSPVYVFFKDEEGRSLRLSRNYEKMLGMPLSQALGKTMDELFPSEMAKGMMADDLRTLKGGKTLKVVEELGGRVYETTKFPVLKDGTPFMLAGFTVDITERKRSEEELTFVSTHDILTGAFNRAYFESLLDRLEQAHTRPVSFVVADVDNLKVVNDSLGHAAGDRLLRGTVEVLHSAVRSADTLARVGGDEFVLVLADADASTSEEILARIKESLAAFQSAHPDVCLNLSLGIATSSDGTLTDAFKLADAQMYEDKRSHKSHA